MIVLWSYDFTSYFIKAFQTKLFIVLSERISDKQKRAVADGSDKRSREKDEEKRLKKEYKKGGKTMNTYEERDVELRKRG